MDALSSILSVAAQEYGESIYSFTILVPDTGVGRPLTITSANAWAAGITTLSAIVV